MTTTTQPTVQPGGKLPPRPVIRVAWLIHRAIYRLTGNPSRLSKNNGTVRTTTPTTGPPTTVAQG